MPDVFMRLTAPGGDLDVVWPEASQLAYTTKRPRIVFAQGLERTKPHFRTTGQEGVRIVVNHIVRGADYNVVNAAMLMVRDVVLFPAAGNPSPDWRGTLYPPGANGGPDPLRPYLLVGVLSCRIRQPRPSTPYGVVEIGLQESTF